MNDRDRMLAEGPRVAPEPRTVVGVGGIVAGPQRARPAGWAGRLVAPAIVVVVVAAQLSGATGVAELLFVGAFLVLGLWKVLRGEERV